jgi:HSP20 family protein
MTVLAKVKNSAPTVPNLSSWFDDWFGRDYPSFFNTGFQTGLSIPAVNIKENPDSFLVELAAPGMNKSDFNIHLDNGLLTISCELQNEDNHSNENFTRKEFSYNSFKRTFTLPDAVNGDKISAKYMNGILAITLPKRDEAKQKPVRTININ